MVGVPGLLLALLYLKVRDYETVDLTPSPAEATGSTGSPVKFISRALVRSPTLLCLCLGGSAQLMRALRRVGLAAELPQPRP